MPFKKYSLIASMLIPCLIQGCYTTSAVMLENNEVIVFEETKKSLFPMPTPHGFLMVNETGSHTFRLKGIKEIYMPGEFEIGPGFSTYHYKGSIKIDRKIHVLVIDLYYAQGEAFDENGRYSYTEK